MECLRWAFRYGRWSPSREEWLLASRLVQQDERDRISRFVYQVDAKAAMSGRLLLRRAIQHLTGLTNSQMFLTRSPHGRPVLQVTPDEYPTLDFNVSHQGGMAVLAAAPAASVGVDVMLVEPARGTRSTDEFFRLMNRQFGPEEWACIRAGANEPDQMRRFYRHWCLKESFVKAVGTGIGYELQRLQCLLGGLSELGPRVLSPEPDPERWSFEEHELCDRFVAAISWRADSKPVAGTFTELEICDLLSGDPLVEWIDESAWTHFANKEVEKGS